MSSTWAVADLRLVRLQWGAVRGQPPRAHRCPHCHIPLLTGEYAGFCCGENGKRLLDVPPLPALPPEYGVFVQDKDISHLSRRLNLLFSFAALESTAAFPPNTGGLAFVAMQGKIYHRVRPNHANSAVRWLLFDGFEAGNMPFANLADTINPLWILRMQQALLRVNSFAQQLLHLGHLAPAMCGNAQVILEDCGAPEMAAIMSFENTSLNEVNPRTIIITRRQDHRPLSIPTISRLWEPLAYPLFFPHGSLGWGLVGRSTDITEEYRGGTRTVVEWDKATTQIWHYRARLLREERFQIFGRLTNEYIVDMFTRNLECRLKYIRDNQTAARADDAELMGPAALLDSENIYLPASFLGSARWASEQIADSLAIAAKYGPPTFFITMTCNPAWPEITSQLRRGQQWADIPIVVCRVFKQRLSRLLQDLKHLFPNAGNILYIMHVVEFQKRGLPHAHILVKYAAECLSATDIDAVISAEIPENADDADLVRSHMIHPHPSPDRPPSKYCQTAREDGSRSCRFGYPKALQPSTTITSEGRVSYRRRQEGDQHVVAHCLTLLRAYRCHLNMECAGSSHLFQYMFKYIHKGPDHTKFALRTPGEPIDEIEDFWNARYLSAAEGAWRILGFHVTRKKPAVTSLPVTITPMATHRRYASRAASNGISKLERYFLRPQGEYTLLDGTIHPFDELLYMQYFDTFRLAPFDRENAGKPGYFLEIANVHGAPRLHVVLRTLQHSHVTRLQPARPTEGERFYLRALLRFVPARSFQDCRTIDGVLHESYQDAANALGLFANNNEAHYAMAEGVDCQSTPHALRMLFVHMLVHDCAPNAHQLWVSFADQLSLDFTVRHGGDHELGRNHALQQLSDSLEEQGRSLTDFGLPDPVIHSSEVEHELMRWGCLTQTLATRAAHARAQFNADQHAIFNAILRAVQDGKSLLAFVDGQAGRGKTFLVNALCNHLRAHQNIVIATATAGHAAQLYPGGRTTHSAFKIPVNELNEMLASPISPSSSRADLIRRAAVIIWDEAPMANRAVLAAVEDVCRRIMGNNSPFGGKIFVLLGDFRQTCPVIRYGSKSEVVDASIKSSPLWPLFHVYRLTTPIRNAEDPDFAAFVDTIGDGAGPTVNLDMLQHAADSRDLLRHVYPVGFVDNPLACVNRSILAPTHKQIDSYNRLLLDELTGDERYYLAADTLKETAELDVDGSDTVLDYAALRNIPGLPVHRLRVKENGIYRMLRNFSIERGLVKNIRGVVTRVGERLITLRILRPATGEGGGATMDDEELLIPRITFSHSLRSGHTLQRRQFPIAPAYATTFNSCQGLTLDLVGVDLTLDVFSHGQLYTALSRIRHRDHGRVLLREGETEVLNVTYHEILL